MNTRTPETKLEYAQKTALDMAETAVAERLHRKRVKADAAQLRANLADWLYSQSETV